MSKAKLLFAFALFAHFASEFSCAQKIRLEDLKAITLEHKKMAASRRYSQPIPQLVCTGGGAGCHGYTPKRAQCINRGWDGYSIQWECKADMPEKYSFGSISVVCEGYDYPEDPYILIGSCSLEYSLEYSDVDFQSHRKSSSYKENNQNQNGDGIKVGLLIAVLVLCAYFIYVKFFSDDVVPRQRPSGPDIGWNIPNASSKENTYQGYGPPPPYSSSESTYDRYGYRGYQTNQGLGGGGGFWTGLGAGGLMGYLFGSQRNPAPAAPRTSSYSSRSFHQGSSSNDDSSSSMRTSTAYGGTKRR